MATIIKHGDGYQAKIRRKGFKTVSKTFASYQRAKHFGITTEAEMLQGRYVCRDSADHTTLREAFERYATEITPQKPGAYTELYRIRFLQSQSFADRVLSSLRPDEFIKYSDERLGSIR